MYIFRSYFCYDGTMESLTPQQQLQKLEQEYSERKAALEQQATETQESMIAGHETMSRVLEGHIQQQVPNFQASSHAPRTVLDSLPPEETAKIQDWINTSFTQGVWQGINQAKKSGDMALIDAFHAALSGQLYDTLIERKKLESVT